jgi:mycofactocin biosynthetic radical S-adenosylmethionine protein MftC
MTVPSLQSVVERSWRENLLFSALVELTYRCDLDCAFCYNDTSLRGKPLSTDQYVAFFSDLRDLQVLNLTLSGGEPLAHPAFFELGAAAKRMGFLIRVKTNGMALGGEFARRLKEEVDPFQIEVSLHGATADTHDRLTRVPGSFDRLLANLREIAPLALRIKLHTVLTSWNEGEIEGMFAIAAGLALPLQVDPDVTPRDDGDRSPLAMAASREGMERLFRLERDRGEEAAQAAGTTPGGPGTSGPASTDVPPRGSYMGKYCGAGSGGIAVDPYGNVYPCVQWRRPCGNLHDRSIGEIWGASRDLQEIRDLQPEILRQVGEFGPDSRLLNFCPGTAEAVTGDPVKVYPAALRRADVLRKVGDDEG